MVQQNPNLISKAAMTAMQSTSGSSEPLLSEILTKVNNAKDKPKKIAVLRENATAPLKRSSIVTTLLTSHLPMS